MALNNYIEDDWEDNALSGRKSVEKGVFYEYGTDGTGDLLKGVYRPMWTVESGGSSASSGILQVPSGNNGNQCVVTPSQMSIGEWSYDWKNPLSADSGACRFNFIDPNNDRNSKGQLGAGYAISWDSGPSYWWNLYRWDGYSSATIIVNCSDWGADDSWHSAKASRDSYGGFEVFRDGSTLGTTTDTNYQETQALSVGNHDGSPLYINNLLLK